MGDISVHANYPYANLFEGNKVELIWLDDNHSTDGRIYGFNGPYNTFVRNDVAVGEIVVNSADYTNIVGNYTNGVGVYSGSLPWYEIGSWGYPSNFVLDVAAKQYNTDGSIYSYTHGQYFTLGAIIQASSLCKDYSYYLDDRPAYFLQYPNVTWPALGTTVQVLADGHSYWPGGTIPAYERKISGGKYTLTGTPLPIPLAVSISGPTSIALGSAGQSTWNAAAYGGHPPYHYQWWYKYPGGIVPASINPTNDNTDTGITSLTKSKPGKIDTVHEDLPPSGTWYQLSETSSSLTTYWYSSFYLKCVVTDANNTSVTSNILYVTVGGHGSQAAPLEQDGLAKIGAEGTIEAEKKITEDKLLQNYPNPFNPTTQINYAVKEDGFVEIKVYDLLGKVVATLVNENKPAGFYTVNFDASRLSSGIYFYTIKTNNFFDRKKMVVVK